MRAKHRRFDNRAALELALTERLRQTLQAPDTGALMLSGGNTPRPAFNALGAQTLHPASGLHILYSDDRYVPSSSPASNYNASQPLIRSLALPENRVLRVRTELSLEEAAADYERRLAEMHESRIPITLGLLGMGADGHTASLFTAADLARARGRLAIAIPQRPDGMSAISVTPEVLAHVQHILMVVSGAEKRDPLARFLAHDESLVAWHAVRDCPDIEVWYEAANA